MIDETRERLEAICQQEDSALTLHPPRRPEASPRSPHSDHRSGSSFNDQLEEFRLTGGNQDLSERDEDREHVNMPQHQDLDRVIRISKLRQELKELEN